MKCNETKYETKYEMKWNGMEWNGMEWKNRNKLKSYSVEKKWNEGILKVN